LLPTARADSPAITLTSYTNYSNGQFTLGFEFTPTTNIYVTSLGSYFPSRATDVHDVTLWGASENVLATAAVAGTGTEGFDFTAITAFELFAGNDYYVGAATATDRYAAWVPPTWLKFTVGPDITYLGAREVSCSGSGTCFPAYVQPGHDAFGANFTYTSSVPEPSSVTLMITMLLGVAFVARKRIARG
jgi:hypothetical protein